MNRCRPQFADADLLGRRDGDIVACWTADITTEDLEHDLFSGLET